MGRGINKKSIFKAFPELNINFHYLKMMAEIFRINICIQNGQTLGHHIQTVITILVQILNFPGSFCD